MGLIIAGYTIKDSANLATDNASSKVSGLGSKYRSESKSWARMRTNNRSDLSTPNLLLSSTYLWTLA